MRYRGGKAVDDRAKMDSGLFEAFAVVAWVYFLVVGGFVGTREGRKN